MKAIILKQQHIDNLRGLTRDGHLLHPVIFDDYVVVTDTVDCSDMPTDMKFWSYEGITALRKKLRKEANENTATD